MKIVIVDDGDEKSEELGIQIISNFLKLNKK